MIINLTERIARMMGFRRGYTNKNLSTSGDVPHTFLVEHGRLFGGVIYSACLDFSSGNGTVDSGTVHNPFSFTVTPGKSSGVVSLVFTITDVPFLIYDTDRIIAKVQTQVQGGTPYIKSAICSAVDNTAAGTTTGFTITMSTSNGSDLTNSDRIYVEILLI